MHSWKGVSLGLAVLLAAASPALAQEDYPDNDPLTTGRTEQPTGTPPATGPHRTAEPTGTSPGSAPSRTDVPLEPTDTGRRATPPPPPKDAGSRSAAPWSWPWSGPRSPEWTQDWTFAHTHFWMLDPGHFELDAAYEGALQRRSHDLDQLFQAKARIGLFPHIELGVTENVEWDLVNHSHDHGWFDVNDDTGRRHGGDVRQEGNEISARFALWDYGTIPLNPSFEVTWHPRHNGVDAWEGRASVGFELLPDLFLAADGFFQGETGGEHHYTWGFHAGATYELVPHVLRVGAEGGVTWQFSPDHTEAFRDTDPEAGPTVLFRPLALLKEEWGNYLKVTANCEAGLRDDNKNVPLLRGVLIIGTQF